MPTELREDTHGVIPYTGRGLTLFEIEDGLRLAVENLTTAREQVELVATESEEARAAALEMFDHAQTALQEYLREEVRKGGNIAGLLRYQQMIVNECDAEIERIDDIKHTAQHVMESVKAMTLGAMQAFDKAKIGPPLATIRRQKNGGAVPVIVTDVALVPSQYIKVTAEVMEDVFKALDCRDSLHVKDRSVLLELVRGALSRGEIVTGCKLGERGEHIRLG